MAGSNDTGDLSNAELRALVVALLGEVVDLKRTVAAQCDEIAHLKGLKGRPDIKPSGMEQATSDRLKGTGRGIGRRGKKPLPRVAIEDRVLAPRFLMARASRDMRISSPRIW